VCVLNLVQITKVLERLAIVNVQVVQLTAPLQVPDYVRTYAIHCQHDDQRFG
jgi:hypothetical protein